MLSRSPLLVQSTKVRREEEKIHNEMDEMVVVEIW